MLNRERTVRLTFDPDFDMAYLHLAEIPAGGVDHTEPLVIETARGVRLVNLDFDKSGYLVGIEFDGARRTVPPPLLDTPK